MMADAGGLHLEGETLKDYVLQKLSRGELHISEGDLFDEMIARLLPPGQGDVRYCSEVITVAALRLQSSPARQALQEHLTYFLGAENGACQTNLGLLGGFVLGILAQQNVPGEEWLGKLREHLQGYLATVMGMGGEECAELAAQLKGIFAALREGK
jgi:hypothetical protein